MNHERNDNGMIRNKTKLTKQIQCSNCGEVVSTPVPTNTVIRAWVECPECIEKKDKEKS